MYWLEVYHFSSADSCKRILRTYANDIQVDIFYTFNTTGNLVTMHVLLHTLVVKWVLDPQLNGSGFIAHSP